MDEAPPRFNFNASDASDSKSDSMASDYTDPWEEVPHYVLVDGKPEVNPAWLTAEFQDTFIYVKDAYKLRVPSSITSVSRAQFNPQTYMGDFQFQNVKNLDKRSEAYNPDGKLGNFRGVLASGFEPINPHVMIVLRHKVCPLDLDLVGCDGNPVSA